MRQAIVRSTLLGWVVVLALSCSETNEQPGGGGTSSAGASGGGSVPSAGGEAGGGCIADGSVPTCGATEQGGAPAGGESPTEGGAPSGGQADGGGTSSAGTAQGGSLPTAGVSACLTDADCKEHRLCQGGETGLACVESFHACTADSQCPSDTYCDAWCRPAPDAGEPCLRGRCGRDAKHALLRCVEETCRPSLGDGDSCTTALDCAGLACATLPPATVPSCHPFAGEGEDCSSLPCKPGLNCALPQQTCVVQGLCYPDEFPLPDWEVEAGFGRCGPEHYCNGGFDSFCRPRLQEGELCRWVGRYDNDLFQACAEGLYCHGDRVPEMEPNGVVTDVGVCTRAPGLNKPCVVPYTEAEPGDALCLDFANHGCSVCDAGLVCDEGVCSLAAKVGESCATRTCAPGLACASARIGGECESDGSAGAAGGGAGGATGGTSSGGTGGAGGAHGAVCQPREEGDCDQPSDCAPGSYCVASHCEPGAELGEPCEPGCGKGLVCGATLDALGLPVAFVCSVPGSGDCTWTPCGPEQVCRMILDMDPSVCAPLPLWCSLCLSTSGGGGTCDDDTHCTPDSYCGPTDLSPNFWCLPRSAAGGSCDVSSSAQTRRLCLSGLYCSSDKRCAPIPGKGDLCGRDQAGRATCLSNLFCDVPTGRCRVPESGDPCAADGCPAPNLYCDAGICRPLRGLGEACAPGGCAVGSYCQGSP